MLVSVENDHKSLLDVQAIVGVSSSPGKVFTLYSESVNFKDLEGREGESLTKFNRHFNFQHYHSRYII